MAAEGNKSMDKRLCPYCARWYDYNPLLSSPQHECEPIPPDTFRLAVEASKRVFTGDPVSAGVDFILNCPLGEEEQSDSAGDGRADKA